MICEKCKKDFISRAYFESHECEPVEPEGSGEGGSTESGDNGTGELILDASGNVIKNTTGLPDDEAIRVSQEAEKIDNPETDNANEVKDLNENGSISVSELAKSLEVENSVVIKACADLDFGKKSHNSKLEESQIVAITKEVQGE